MKNLKSLALCFSLVALSLNALAAGKVNLDHADTDNYGQGFSAKWG